MLAEVIRRFDRGVNFEFFPIESPRSLQRMESFLTRKGLSPMVTLPFVVIMTDLSAQETHTHRVVHGEALGEWFQDIVRGIVEHGPGALPQLRQAVFSHLSMVTLSLAAICIRPMEHNLPVPPVPPVPPVTPVTPVQPSSPPPTPQVMPQQQPTPVSEVPTGPTPAPEVPAGPTSVSEVPPRPPPPPGVPNARANTSVVNPAAVLLRGNHAMPPVTPIRMSGRIRNGQSGHGRAPPQCGDGTRRGPHLGCNTDGCCTDQ